MNVNINLMVENLIQIKNGITTNFGAGIKIDKKHRVCKKYYTWNHVICSYQNGKYSANIRDDSVVTRDEIIKETKSIPKIFHKIINL